jgi:hypothetical protein
MCKAKEIYNDATSRYAALNMAGGEAVRCGRRGENIVCDFSDGSRMTFTDTGYTWTPPRRVEVAA